MLDKNKKNSPFLILIASFMSAVLITFVYLYTGDNQNKSVNTSNFNMLGFSNIGMIDIFFAVSFIFVGFVLIRELITWYWKINRAIELLEKIEENTRK
jgi:small-conductance mechanosensitive channel